jgi:hypothetical protein
MMGGEANYLGNVLTTMENVLKPPAASQAIPTTPICKNIANYTLPSLHGTIWLVISCTKKVFSLFQTSIGTFNIYK